MTLPMRGETLPQSRRRRAENSLSQLPGGVRVNVVKDALKAGADILVVGRAITASKDIKRAADEFIEHMDKEEIDQFRVMTDF